MWSEIVDSLDGLSSAEWNNLAGPADLYSSHEWLRAVEDDSPDSCQYLLIRDDEAIVAGLPLYFVSDDADPPYLPANHFPGLPTASRYCLAGSRNGYRNSPLWAANLSGQDRNRALRLLFDALDDVLAAAQVDAAYLMFLTGDGLDAVEKAGAASTKLLAGVADTWIDPVGTSLDDYLASMTRNRRKAIGKEIIRFARAGLTVTVEDPREWVDRIVGMTDQVYRKYGREVSGQQLRSRLARQFAVLGNAARLFVCRHHGEPIGLTLSYVWREYLYLRSLGMNYARLPGVYEYFNLTIYEPLRYCYSAGLRGIHLGAGSPHAKAARGARIEPLTIVRHGDRTPSHLNGIWAAVERGTRNYWRRQSAEQPRSFDPDLWHRLLDNETVFPRTEVAT